MFVNLIVLYVFTHNIYLLYFEKNENFQLINKCLNTNKYKYITNIHWIKWKCITDKLYGNKIYFYFVYKLFFSFVFYILCSKYCRRHSTVMDQKVVEVLSFVLKLTPSWPIDLLVFPRRCLRWTLFLLALNCDFVSLSVF